MSVNPHSAEYARNRDFSAVSEDHILDLLYSTDRESQNQAMSIAKNPTLPPALIDLIINDTGNKFWFPMLENPALTPETIERVYKHKIATFKPNISHPITSVTSRLFNNPSTPKEVIQHFYEEVLHRRIPNFRSGTGFLRHPNCPLYIIDANFSSQQQTILANPTLPYEYVEKAEPRFWEIALGSNRNLPEAFLWKMLELTKAQREDYFGYNIPIERSVADNPNITQTIIDYLIETNPGSYQNLVFNARVPATSLRKILASEHSREYLTLSGAIINPNIDESLLEEILVILHTEDVRIENAHDMDNLFNSVATRLKESFAPYTEWPLEWVEDYVKAGT